MRANEICALTDRNIRELNSSIHFSHSYSVFTIKDIVFQKCRFWVCSQCDVAPYHWRVCARGILSLPTIYPIIVTDYDFYLAQTVYLLAVVLQ